MNERMTDAFSFTIRASTQARIAKLKRGRFATCDEWFPVVFIGALPVHPVGKPQKTQAKALAAANRQLLKIVKEIQKRYSA